MSRFVLGNCIDVMARIPDNAIDFILTDPPYLVGFRDRQGRTIAGDKTDEWLQPACNEMYRVLKKDALMVSFYAKPVTLNVEECDRLFFLPYLFGQDFLYVEASVCALAKKMMPEYEGGFWHFIRLPDGGGYMMPDGDRFHLVNGENWFDRTVSADAAGIILTSLVINRQLWLYHDSGDAGLTHLYRMRDAQLWSHIEFHPECNAIYAALD